MKDNKNILRRALDFDLNEAELAAFYKTTEQSETFHDDVLAEQLAEDLFAPEKALLLAEKRKELEALEMKPKQKGFVLPLRLLGVAAGVVALVGMLVLMRPDGGGEITEEMVAEFSELARGAYSPEVLAALERSDEVSDARSEHIELVRAFEKKDYEFVLENTVGEERAGEVRLLRARVLMDLGRYGEGLEILEGIDEEELMQRDAWLWMRAEGELNVKTHEGFEAITKKIKDEKLPGYLMIKKNN